MRGCENDKRVVEFAEKHFKFSSKRSGVEVKMLLPMNEYSSDAETRDFKCDVVSRERRSAVSC